MKRPPIPMNSADAWESVQSDISQNKKFALNAGLVFDRFIADWGSDSAKDAKHNAFTPVLDAANKYADTRLLAGLNARWEKSAEPDGAQGDMLFTLQTDWRMIAGLGRKGPLEVGFTFNRYGFPVLPGSSVKGIARATAFYDIAEKLGMEGNALKELDSALSEDDPKKLADWLRELQPSEEAAKWIAQFRRAFGTTGNAGQAVFFDAIPEKRVTVELDIMNPHYPDYYKDTSGKTAPTNWQSPTPIFFLAVAAKQRFRFAIGWRGKPDAGAHRAARDWLENGLKDLGAGGKTSAGYGYFEDLATSQSNDLKPSVAILVEPPKDAAWKKGNISNDGKSIRPADAPDKKLNFQREHVLPKDYTPARKAEVEYFEQTLPDGSIRVWVKRKYYPVD